MLSADEVTPSGAHEDKTGEAVNDVGRNGAACLVACKHVGGDSSAASEEMLEVPNSDMARMPSALLRKVGGTRNSHRLRQSAAVKDVARCTATALKMRFAISRGPSVLGDRSRTAFLVRFRKVRPRPRQRKSRINSRSSSAIRVVQEHVVADRRGRLPGMPQLVRANDGDRHPVERLRPSRPPCRESTEVLADTRPRGIDGTSPAREAGSRSGAVPRCLPPRCPMSSSPPPILPDRRRPAWTNIPEHCAAVFVKPPPAGEPTQNAPTLPAAGSTLDQRADLGQPLVYGGVRHPFLRARARSRSVRALHGSLGGYAHE